MTENKRLLSWVAEVKALCKPDRVEWCDGSRAEYDRVMKSALAAGAAIRLDPAKRPNSCLFRS
ncbi:MAG: phosphoenolpyruvate carboxykinase, partial [Phycisphaerae bacterium]|nr:phosphoenolpyruvate carboxykinase [Phycisphaerae bacterium]